MRMWAAWAAEKVLGTNGTPVWVQLATDDDPEIAGYAILCLAEYAPQEARQLIPKLRRQTRKHDPYLPTQAAWVLAAVGAKEARPDIEALARDPKYPWHAIDAQVALMMLDGQDGEILELLRRHERHEWTRALSFAATLIRSDASAAALEEAAENSPDQQCRVLAANALDEWTRRQQAAKAR